MPTDQATLLGGLFTDFDLLLIFLCPLCSLLGMTVSFAVRELDDDYVRYGLLDGRFYKRTMESFNLFLLAIALGVGTALLFVGALNPEGSSLARVMALAIFVGYQARNVWLTQEKVINKIIDKRIEQALKKNKLIADRDR